MLFNTYFGIGYEFGNNKSSNDVYNDDVTSYNYINQRLSKSPGFSLTGGIKLGLLLK